MSRDLSAAQLRDVVATERVLLSPLCSEPHEDGWPAAAVEAVMRLLDACQGSLFHVAPSNLAPPLSWEYSTLDATMLRSYRTDFWRHDFLTRRMLASGLDVMDMWCLMSPAEYKRSLFIQEYLRPNAIPDGIVLKTVLGGRTLISVMNSDRMLDTTKTRSWSALLDLVRPAFAAGAAARQLLGHHREQLGQVVDDLGVPVLFADASARVLHRNVALCALLAQDPGADDLLRGAHRLLAQLRAFLLYSSTPAEREQLARLDERSDDEIDLSDIPEISDEMWSRTLRGVSGPSEYYRALKQQITLRLDKDIIAWFKANAERGYQTEINRVLREYVMRKVANAHRRRRA